MKRNLLLSILCSLLILPASSLGEELRTLTPDTTYVDGNIRIHLFSSRGVTVAEVPVNFDFIFVPKEVGSLKSVAEKGRFRFLINGSFYEGTRLDARHAGWLAVGGKVLAPLKDDRQLTHVVRVDRKRKRTEFVSQTTFKPIRKKNILEFQTGPIIVECDSITHGAIERSINGMGKYPRCLIATLNRSRIFFVTVRTPVDLKELGRYLSRMSVFKGGRLDVVNLDGGSSVALYSKKFDRLNFNQDAKLPLLLGIR